MQHTDNIRKRRIKVLESEMRIMPIVWVKLENGIVINIRVTAGNIRKGVVRRVMAQFPQTGIYPA